MNQVFSLYCPLTLNRVTKSLPCQGTNVFAKLITLKAGILSVSPCHQLQAAVKVTAIGLLETFTR